MRSLVPSNPSISRTPAPLGTGFMESATRLARINWFSRCRRSTRVPASISLAAPTRHGPEGTRRTHSFRPLETRQVAPNSSVRPPQNGVAPRYAWPKRMGGLQHVASHGGYVMRHSDFAPFYRSAIGFDRLFQMLDQVNGYDAESTYPPYNIERTGDNAYRITLAVAGFSTDELKIEVKEQTLTISGEKAAETGHAHVPAPWHRGSRLRAPLPARGPRGCDGCHVRERIASRRPRPQHAGKHEAAHGRHSQRRCEADRSQRRLSGAVRRRRLGRRLAAAAPFCIQAAGAVRRYAILLRRMPLGLARSGKGVAALLSLVPLPEICRIW